MGRKDVARILLFTPQDRRFTTKAQRTHRGLRPQPKDVLTRRHEATKRKGEMPPPNFVALWLCVRIPHQKRGFEGL